MHEITIPKLNTVDTEYTLIEWLHPDGTRIPAGAEIAVVETSKAAEELLCDHEGILHHLVPAPHECPLGATIALVFDTIAERERYLSGRVPDAPTDRDPGGPIITDAARSLMDRHGISEARVAAIGRKVIKTADVERLIADGAEPQERYVPSRSQRAVAATVSRSHATIPAASAVITLDVDAALAFLRARAERDQVIIGLPELVIQAVARLRGEFPLFFATLDADGSATVPTAAHVGATVDVGTGLYVPVVRDADALRLATIAERLMEFRITALRGQFRADDLAGGTIAVSLSDDPAIVATQPLILPPMVCMLSLGAARAGLDLDTAGAVRRRMSVHLGAAYDHRLINGREAALFLRAIKDRLEDVERLEALDTYSADRANGQSTTPR